MVVVKKVWSVRSVQQLIVVVFCSLHSVTNYNLSDEEQSGGALTGEFLDNTRLVNKNHFLVFSNLADRLCEPVGRLTDHLLIMISV